MAKFTLKAEPTFIAKVAWPVAGGEPVQVRVTFKHRTKSALDEFIKARTSKSDVETFLDMVSGWELTDEFTSDNVELLLEHHIGVAVATYEAYLRELVAHRRGN